MEESFVRPEDAMEEIVQYAKLVTQNANHQSKLRNLNNFENTG